MMHRVNRSLGAVALCAVACGSSYGQAATPRTIHEALGLEMPGMSTAAAGEPELVDRTEGARGTSGCPIFDGTLCQCPDFRTAYNVTGLTQYEKVYLDSVVVPFLPDLGWSEVYSGGAAGVGDVTIAIFEDDNGLPGNLIWVGTSGTEFAIIQIIVGEQLLGFDVHEMVASMTGSGAGFPDLRAYSGQCVHIGINHSNIPGGADAYWTTSNSSIGDQRHYFGVGVGGLPGALDNAPDDLQVCLNYSGGSHQLGPVLTHCPPADCTIGHPIALFTTLENEGDCGSPTDTVNGGCNSTPFVTSTLPAGRYGVGTVFGTPDDGAGNWSRETDWWEVTHDGGELVFGAHTDFVAQLFIIDGSTLDCVGGTIDFVLDFIVPECTPAIITAGVQPAGTYYFFVAQNPFADFRTLACGEGNYVIWDAGRDACPVDVTGDGIANFVDLTALSTLLNTSDTEVAPESDAWLMDLNNDGGIDLRDYSRFAADPCTLIVNGGTASSATQTSIGLRAWTTARARAMCLYRSIR